MCAPRQRMADENCIVPGGIQFSVRLVRNGDRRKLLPTIHFKRICFGEKLNILCFYCIFSQCRHTFLTTPSPLLKEEGKSKASGVAFNLRMNSGLHGTKRFIEVFENVIDVLDADRDSDQLRRNTRITLLFF